MISHSIESGGTTGEAYTNATLVASIYFGDGDAIVHGKVTRQKIGLFT